MPSQKLVTNFSNFSGGVITESNPLAFPENTARILNNVMLNRNGTVFRRLGLDIENDGRRSGATNDTNAATDAVSVHPWGAVNGNGEQDFIVVQWAGKLIVHDASTENYNDIGRIKAEWSYEPLKIDTSSNWRTTAIDGVAGSGRFFGCSRYISPFYIEYDADADTFTVNKLSLKIRDVDGLDETNDTSAVFDGVPVNNDGHLIKDTQDTISGANTTTSWQMGEATDGVQYE